MKIILGITGASGFIYGKRALELMANAGVEVHLVISDSALINMELEGNSFSPHELNSASKSDRASGDKHNAKSTANENLDSATTHTSINLPRMQSGSTDLEQLKSLAYKVHDNKSIGASIASGSFKCDGMLIAPCSINTMSAIASGITNSLVARAADVTLKERRKLVLMVRETPLHLGHLRSMCTITEIGGIIYPPVPSFYHNPKNIQDIVDHSVGRALDLFNIDTDIKRWTD